MEITGVPFELLDLGATILGREAYLYDENPSGLGPVNRAAC